MLNATTRKCTFRKMGFGGSPVTDGNKGWTPASSGIGVLDYRLKMLPGESSYYRSTQSPFCSDGSWKPGIGSLKVQSQLSQVREAASLEIGSRELWFCDQNGTSAVHRQSRHQKIASRSSKMALTIDAPGAGSMPAPGASMMPPASLRRVHTAEPQPSASLAAATGCGRAPDGRRRAALSAKSRLPTSRIGHRRGMM